ncbi:MAG: ABC transporter substrate-binding protein [Thermoplasmata archaeon]|nr:ABC transporter substrate-binding protein [Thermoplasmata archaeon]
MGGATVTAHQNFVWTVFVAPAGVHAGTTGASASASPHNGTLRIYELAPGGARSFDPSIEYDTVSGEVGLNLYQTLIQYNGSAAGPDPADFVPYLAACVPGSTQCSNLFPTSTQGAAAGTALTFPATRGYTFVINSASQFYDHGSGAHWGVYPTDVMFSIIRTEMFTDQPFATANNGWLIAQALIDAPGAGIHSPYDNSPASSFSRILVNSSAYCPSLAMTSSDYHGCVTFLANGSGVNWPFFLELMADWAGAGIEPCGWYSAGAQGASIPGWTDTSAYTSSTGDHPCALPGGASSTDAAAYHTAVNAIAPTAWDNLQTLGSSPPYVGNVRWAVVSSGPYYLVNTLIGSSYTLGASPVYAANPNCNYAGCMPASGKYAPNVQVIWESSATDGELAYRAGTTDAASIPTTDTSILLQLEQQGKVQAQQFPTISMYFWCFNMWFPVAAAQHFTTNKITVPSDFFSYNAVREFFAHAFPYNTTEQTISTVDGIPYFFNYGGAIPEFMGNYYPANVSWPSGDPPSGAPAGSAAWWWTQGTTAGSPYYDPELAACSTSSPCTVPFIGQTGAPNIDQMSALLQSELSSLSGGKLKLILLDINFADLVNNAFGPPPNPMPFYQLGWAPDYPDPTDYTAAMYQSGAGYTGADAVGSQFALAPFNGATYPGGSCPTATDYVGYAHMAEQMGGIPTACQGRAFSAMNYIMNIAGGYQANATRVLLFNFASQIANALTLYIYWGQQNAVLVSASWIDPNTPNVSVMIGGSSMQTWWSWGGTNVH